MSVQQKDHSFGKFGVWSSKKREREREREREKGPPADDCKSNFTAAAIKCLSFVSASSSPLSLCPLYVSEGL
jgi:hypothetical protein